MSEEMITKKELLALTGISYGQLYRWKRKGLIPEEWFIHRATFTGQETYFPKQKVLARLEKIQHLKEDASLDDLAGVFSPRPSDIRLTRSAVVACGIASTATLDFITERAGDTEPFIFSQLVRFHLVDAMLRGGEVTREEATVVLSLLTTQAARMLDRPGELLLVRKFGVSVCCLVTISDAVTVDAEARVVARMSIADAMETIKHCIRKGEDHGS